MKLLPSITALLVCSLFLRYVLTFIDHSLVRWRMTLAVGILGATTMLYAAVCCAQQLETAAAIAATPQVAMPASSTKSLPAVASTFAWNRLTPLQQQALKPLATSWQSISEAQRMKWLAISKNYLSLPPAEQLTMHGRMNEWVALSPAQRAEARLNFAKTKELSAQLTPEEKLSKWQAYQALSPAEKENLASKAGPKPVGAALAVRPVPPQKLVGVMPHAQSASAPARPVVPALAAKPTNAASDTVPSR